MSQKKIKDDLDELCKELGKLRIATPIEHPSYKIIEEMYRKASDLAEEATEKAIDEADDDYISFSNEMTNAINLLKEAQEDIKKVANAIQKVAKLIDIAGKIIEKIT